MRRPHRRGDHAIGTIAPTPRGGRERAIHCRPNLYTWAIPPNRVGHYSCLDIAGALRIGHSSTGITYRGSHPMSEFEITIANNGYIDIPVEEPSAPDAAGSKHGDGRVATDNTSSTTTADDRGTENKYPRHLGTVVAARDDRVFQPVGGPVSVAWREGTLTRAHELEALCEWNTAEATPGERRRSGGGGQVSPCSGQAGGLRAAAGPAQAVPDLPQWAAYRAGDEQPRRRGGSAPQPRAA